MTTTAFLDQDDRSAIRKSNKQKSKQLLPCIKGTKIEVSLEE